MGNFMSNILPKNDGGGDFSAYNKILVAALLAWSIVILLAAIFYWSEQKREVVALAKNTARTALDKDLATRMWAIAHGGVYVDANKGTPPNPYLSHVPERDVVTPSGKHLTLMNSSYILRQMMENYSGLYGTKTRISSTDPRNPNNRSDAWEQKALGQLKNNKLQTEYFEVGDVGRDGSLRLMIPMKADETCLKCHVKQNYQSGDIVGGIDITVPFATFIAKKQPMIERFYAVLSVIWLFGCAVIIVSFWAVRKKALELREKEIEKNRNYESMISLVVDLIDKRDSYTAGHSQRVAYYCELIARGMYHDEQIVKKIKEAAILHDVGKIAIPDSILLKPGRLTLLEHDLIKYHLRAGYELLSRIDMYKDLAEIVGAHHERYDGNGYPNGLKADEIPPLSRIMILADAFDAMTTDRIYKPHKSVDEALDEIKLLKGMQFDPEVVDIAVIVLRDVVVDHSSQLPKTAIEQERLAYYIKDQLTGLNNHWALERTLQSNQHSAEYRFATIISIKNLFQFNDRYGWQKGDAFLEEFGSLLKNLYLDYPIYRIFGDKFIVLSQEYLDINSQVLLANGIFDDSGLEVTVTVLHLVDQKINSIGKLEEIAKTQKDY